MKHGKKLTVEMKMLLKKNGYDPDDFLYIKNTPNIIHFLNRNTKEIVMIEREKCHFKKVPFPYGIQGFFKSVRGTEKFCKKTVFHGNPS